MYRVILTPRLGQGQRVSVDYPTLGPAISFAKQALKEPEFQRVTVFDRAGKIVTKGGKP